MVHKKAQNVPALYTRRETKKQLFPHRYAELTKRFYSRSVPRLQRSARTVEYEKRLFLLRSSTSKSLTLPLTQWRDFAGWNVACLTEATPPPLARSGNQVRSAQEESAVLHTRCLGHTLQNACCDIFASFRLCFRLLFYLPKAIVVTNNTLKADASSLSAKTLTRSSICASPSSSRV